MTMPRVPISWGELIDKITILEIKAERVSDPDTLSTRIQSEVYALPPLPTTRSIRKLS